MQGVLGFRRRYGTQIDGLGLFTGVLEMSFEVSALALLHKPRVVPPPSARKFGKPQLASLQSPTLEAPGMKGSGPPKRLLTVHGLSERDTADVLGISPQIVSELTDRANASRTRSPLMPGN
ncbi:hypothetical protein Mycch_5440 (plasmid) [Mycolicibacterium chubuense NBB4]|uniref:Uncharacterized protein n=2 Tax=Mycolicibacterium chubuense TaxID=1800 RepID=I4BS55_MYCCN|nr:hypothetical protein Mycch_5440 [Mycolicibacterium chubuense NBB4]